MLSALHGPPGADRPTAVADESPRGSPARLVSLVASPVSGAVSLDSFRSDWQRDAGVLRRAMPDPVVTSPTRPIQDPPERIQRARLPIESLPLGKNVLVNVTPGYTGYANELSLTVVPSAAEIPILFVSYNTPLGISRSRSIDGGATWESALNNLPILRASTEPATPAVDSFAVAVGPPRMVAVTAVASNAPATRGYVGVWVSTDGGRSFPRGIVISEGLSGPSVDGPKMAADPENRCVWVWWMSLTKGGGLSTYQNWLRRVDIEADGTPILRAPPINLTSLRLPFLPTIRALPLDYQSSITIKSNGPGQLPRIFLIHTDNVEASGGFDKCATEWPSMAVRWYMSYSDNGGYTWITTLIATDYDWPRCNAPRLRGVNRPNAFAVYDPRSDRLFITFSKSAYRISDLKYVGTRAFLYAWPGRTSGSAFDVWIPVCNPAGAGDELFRGHLLPPGETYCLQYGPSVGLLHSGDWHTGPRTNVAWMWYDTRDSRTRNPDPGDRTIVDLETDIWAATVDPDLRYLPYGAHQRRLTPLSDGVQASVSGAIRFGGAARAAWVPVGRVPWRSDRADLDPPKNNVWWGDYSSGVVPLGDRFFGMWADMRDNKTYASLYGCSFG